MRTLLAAAESRGTEFTYPPAAAPPTANTGTRGAPPGTILRLLLLQYSMSALGRLSHLEWGGCKPSRRESHESRQASRLANGLPSMSTARLGGCATVCSIHVPQDRLALSNEPPMKCMSSANRSSVAQTAMTPLSDGGGEAAACSAAMPPQEQPRSTTCPSHHACCAAHSTASFRSCKPWLLYSSSRWPSLSPLPRLSRRTHANPCPAR
mmetsp:Transcript_41972/g.80285  ORF Transcript_41972/g.80285 Transcript_41972/m.80285 type:complete len:209 (+) Transcript_41972:307-933(+)